MTFRSSRRWLTCFDLVEIKLNSVLGVKGKNLGVCVLKFLLSRNKGHPNEYVSIFNVFFTVLVIFRLFRRTLNICCMIKSWLARGPSIAKHTPVNSDNVGHENATRIIKFSKMFFSRLFESFCAFELVLPIEKHRVKK